MATIAKWNGHKFTVSPKLIQGFSGLTIKGSSETEDIESGGQKYVSRKGGKPSEISLTAELNAFTGCDVKGEAMKFVEDAENGEKGYFYLGGKKLLTCQLMLTEASVTETQLAPGGKWVSCKVKLTMKKSMKNDGTTGGSFSNNNSNTGGSKKPSLKQQSTIAAGVAVGAIASAAAMAAIGKGIAATAQMQKSVFQTARDNVTIAQKTSAPTKKVIKPAKISPGKSILMVTLK